jgi:FdhD protein
VNNSDQSELNAAATDQLVSVTGRRANALFNQQDRVAQEIPIALEFNGVAHAVMLATPNNLHDFALGFSLSEGILQQPSQLYDCEVIQQRDGIVIQMNIASAAFEQLKKHRRTMAGRTGCGLCGAENLSQVIRPLASLPAAKPSDCIFDANIISAALLGLGHHQPLQQVTGAVHAAAWCTANGQLKIVREDVGRHNALDKVIGALARDPSLKAASGFFVVTSRASFEMVQKTISAKVPLLVAVSAATAFAVQIANDNNLSLIGFARDQDLVVYTHPERIIFN